MSMQKVAGLVLLVVGVILLYFGWQSSQSIGDQLAESFTGRFTDETLWLLVGGAAAVVAGGALAFFRR